MFALIILSSPLSFTSSVSPAVLSQEAPAPGTAVTLAGWGQTNEGRQLSTNLRRVKTSITDDAECATRYEGDAEFRFTPVFQFCDSVFGGGEGAVSAPITPRQSSSAYFVGPRAPAIP